MKLLRNGRKFVIVPLVVLLAALLAGTALAGGWATIEMGELPGEIHAGESVRLSFMVYQHGKTPVHFLAGWEPDNTPVEPVISGTNVKTGETIEIAATLDKSEVGRFYADIVFPEAGEWSWTIAPNPLVGTTELAPLTILPALKAPVVETGNTAETAAEVTTTTTAATAPESGGTTILPWAGGLLLVVGAAMMALLISRRKQQMKVAVD